MNKIKVFFLSYAILSSLSLFSQELKHKKNDYTFLGSEKPSVITLKKKYTTTHYTWLCDILNNAEFLRIYVRRELEKRNMPSYIEYLPLVRNQYLSPVMPAILLSAYLSKIKSEKQSMNPAYP